MTEDYQAQPEQDLLQRPESFEFALDFLGDPEAIELRSYIEQLEARAALAEPAPPAAGDVGEMPTYDDLSELCSKHGLDADDWPLEKFDALWEVARAVLARYGHQPAPPAEGEVAELVAWLREQADNERGCEFDECEGAVFDAADKLTRAADLLSQRHPAPVPVSEKPLAQEAYIAFVQICKGSSDDAGTYEDDEKLVRSALKRLAELEVFPQRHPAPVPAGMIPVEYWDIDSGARIVTEPSEEGPGGCWVVLNSRHVNPFTEFPTAKAAWDALQQAHALPLPQGESQP